MRWGWMLVLLSIGCYSEPMGDHFVAPDPNIDEDFFFCRIQPEIINGYGCATGSDCHTRRDPILDPAAELETPPTCDGDDLVGPVPDSWQANLEAVRFTVRADPLSSPFYLRPTAEMSHPLIFETGSEPAGVIVEWLTQAP